MFDPSTRQAARVLCAGNGLRYLLHPTMFRPSARLAMGRNVIFLQTALFR